MFRCGISAVHTEIAGAQELELVPGFGFFHIRRSLAAFLHHQRIRVQIIHKVAFALFRQQQEIQQKLHEKMDRWVYLNDLAEQIENQKE